jgi:S-adenosylmethionine:tRNA-ribosyltransferase-isomerase (queuine synthetase)
MNLSTQSFQELVIQELAELSEDQQEEALSFIYSLKRKKLLTPQDQNAQEVLIALKQFPEEKQQRLNFLAKKNTEGAITKEECSELEELVDEAQSLMLQNTENIARVVRPNLFDKKGRPIKRLITQAVREKTRRETHTRKSKRQKENTS